MKNKNIKIYVAFYHDIRLAASEDKKQLKNFLKTRKMFLNIMDSVTYEEIIIESRHMFEKDVEDLMIISLYDRDITGLEYKIIKDDYFMYLNDLYDNLKLLNKLTLIAIDKKSVIKTIDEINKLMDDPYSGLNAYISNHYLLDCRNLMKYSREIRTIKDAIDKCGKNIIFG